MELLLGGVLGTNESPLLHISLEVSLATTFQVKLGSETLSSAVPSQGRGLLLRKKQILCTRTAAAHTLQQEWSCDCGTSAELELIKPEGKRQTDSAP